MKSSDVWQKKGRASVLFRGEDGNYYKSGYAPILVGDEVVAREYTYFARQWSILTALPLWRETILQCKGKSAIFNCLFKFLCKFDEPLTLSTQG